MKIIMLMFLLITNISYAYNTNIKDWNRITKNNDIIKQTTDFSCGPASLSLILKKEKNIDVKEMDIISDILYRSEKGTEIEKIDNGFSLLDLKKSAERIGVKMKGVRYNDIEKEKIKTPSIILLEGKNYSHFVVLDYIDTKYATILDPEKGIYHFPLYKLKSIWKGYSLVIGDI
ncbi:hypothetical protein G3G77_004876 [Salmonella enterica]|uniref:Peptidase C39 domain-containing protein n=1 Tax=Salmonella enterica TaxID=28901 RepID=A0A402WLY4_SALER|nr:hypothetical protein [Salmonella enterica]EAO7618772.1 hypothetical protein [Salmonella enterica]EAQ6819409.1 hypothetical protein [Salmonella enterica]EAS2063686.1 hypothetical protein [Salmonella enterica]EAS2070509.1 hypothetical protein [Salmonella enterica]